MSVGAARPAPIDEREFHRWLARHLSAGREGLLPIGDDAAGLLPPTGAVAVLTTDALVEGTHFLRRSPPERIGSAAVAVSLSDLAAKGARPAGALLALVVPPGTPRTWAARVVRGAERTCAQYGIHVVGGDTKPGAVRAVVGFAIGWGQPGRLAPRPAARAGDLLAVTGTVGRGGQAAERLRRRPGGRRVLTELLDVRPRVVEGALLARWAHAMLDTSDGLAEATWLLSRASRKKVVVEEPRIPYAPQLLPLASDPGARRALAFYGGDYELLAAFAPSDVPRARRAVARVGGSLTVIGSVSRGSGAWLVVDGHERKMPKAGWQPFGRREAGPPG